jgi:hypothetical protein
MKKMENKEEKNIFEEVDMELNDVPESEETKTNEVPSYSDEVDIDNLSDTPVGQNKKYTRESLDGETVKVLSAKMFNPDRTNDDIITSMTNPDSKYYKTKFLITFDKENSEGVKHREYLSGAIQFIQKDGSISAPSLWYEGADNQVATLFNKVANAKGVEPKELSPREFMNFLNSGPKCVMKYTDVKFNKVIYHKNLVEKFI